MVKLAIADPPYLGKSVMFYGGGDGDGTIRHGKFGLRRTADFHPEAAVWDDPESHRELVAKLMDEYDGWAIAMIPSSLRYYLQWVPERTRVAVWHDPNVMPTGSHPRRRWEPVLVYAPEGRRRIVDIKGPGVGDVMTTSQNKGTGSFAGAKPAAWTRWVMDMLDYRAGEDSIDDLFGGSGSVQAVIDQPMLAIEWR